MSYRYIGREKTREAYKAERQRIMRTIKSLEKQGVVVPESLIPRQGGKVLYEDVQKLKSLTRKKILEKSQLTIDGITYKGKDVPYEYKKKQNRERIQRSKVQAEERRIEKEKQRQKEEDFQKWKDAVEAANKEILDEGNIDDYFDEEEDIEQESDKTDEEKLRDWIEENSDNGDDSDGEDEDEDEDDSDYYEDSEDFGNWDSTLDTIVDNFLDLADSVSIKSENQNKKTRDAGGNAIDAADYLRRAIGIYGRDAVGRALLEAEGMGIDIDDYRIFYAEEFPTFITILRGLLPLDGAYDDMINSNDRNDSMEDTDD